MIFQSDITSRLQLSLMLALIVMATNYFNTVNFGSVVGGEYTRNILKIICLGMWMSCISRFNVKRIIFLFPIIYIALFPIFFITTIEGTYLQAINFSLCVPLLLIDYTKVDVEYLLKKIVIYSTVLIWISYFSFRHIQILENSGFVGIVGNPNSLGLLCSILILFSYLINNNAMRVFIILSNIIFSSLTGSLLALLLPVITVFMIARYRWKIISFMILSVFALYSRPIHDFILDSGIFPSALMHAFRKLDGLISLISLREVGNLSFSFENRFEYHEAAFERLRDLPSLVFGHNNFTEVYFTGDGGLIGYAATHGLVIFIAFLFSNFLCYLSARQSGVILQNRIGSALIIIFLTLITNRTLDYWPMGVFYALFIGVATSKSQGQLTKETQCRQFT